MRLDDNQRRDWLRLSRSEGIGPRNFRVMLTRHGSAAAALAALPELARRTGRPIKAADPAAVDREIDAATRLGVRYVALGEADYPLALSVIDSVPPLIAVRGHVAALAGPAAAVVGSRNASAAGLTLAERLARALGTAGYAVVSGLARGIDAQAHRSSLDTGTVAVLAGGHDRIYPPEHGKLLAGLLERGAAISEMPMGWVPRGRDFPGRNRLVSGLSLGVVVVEAAMRSGSLITARFALEQGREVFAVPGSPLDPRAAGTNDLIRQGATLCADPEHVLSVLAPLREGPRPHLDDRAPQTASLWDEAEVFSAPPPRPDRLLPLEAVMPTAPRASQPHETVLALLGSAPVSVDDLVRASELTARDVQVALLELELSGRIERHGAQAVSLAPGRPV
ncbi:DNA-processing protein DprA [Chelatococcus reniformis]|uniref:DNA-processing protein DprA n=1 Tax=Chelatococcus reniformis TaxID=1494448 RepID=UPI001665290B|nr:DNA-processing protein DprA [Chelatococcus reniformis]